MHEEPAVGVPLDRTVQLLFQRRAPPDFPQKGTDFAQLAGPPNDPAKRCEKNALSPTHITAKNSKMLRLPVDAEKREACPPPCIPCLQGVVGMLQGFQSNIKTRGQRASP